MQLGLKTVSNIKSTELEVTAEYFGNKTFLKKRA